MTPEAQRIAIAEALEWKKVTLGNLPEEIWEKLNEIPWARAESNLPDYTVDWNTRPEMLAYLAALGLQPHFTNNIQVFVNNAKPQPPNDPFREEPWDMLSVPQDMFCLAFLETLNLWKP
jgi:hypothetical protein